ncbi:MAG TPA: SCO family protein [Thermoanaerobaculia bacterium]|nr:SCO family protein [Thermoanaerobaculia bacterium]
MRGARVVAVALTLIAGIATAQTSATPPRLPGKVGITQKHDAQVPLDAMFRDEQGKVVRLGDYFRGKPVILNFVYFRCPMLCSMVTEGLTSTLTELKFDAAKDFEIVTISIDPRDDARGAAAKKEKAIKRYGRTGAASGWHFLTGPEMSIRKVSNAVGFDYAYDIESDQFAHGAMIAVLTPQGRVSRYLYGFEYKPRDVRLALVEASAGKIGTASDQLLLLCYHYDPRTGKYSRSAMNLVRAGGVATVVSLVSFIAVMIRRDRMTARRGPRPVEEKR